MEKKKEIHLTQRINICDTHFTRNAIDRFWSELSLVIVYNINRKMVQPAQTVSKVELHPKNMMPIRSDYNEIKYRCFRSTQPTTYEIGGRNQREKARIGKSWRNRVPPRQCEAPYKLATRTNLSELGWEVTSHPP